MPSDSLRVAISRGRPLRLLLAIAAAALALAYLALGNSHAQVAPPIEIASVEHDPRGVVVAGVKVRTEDVHALEMTVLVDGVPYSVSARDIESAPRSAILLAIDTSGSMAGSPIAAARDAAIRLVGELRPDDEVALVAFSDRPRLLVPFTSDHARTTAAISGLTAAGGTALYDTVVFATSMLSEKVEMPRALVILSDGQDSGASSATRAASLNTAADAGLTAYAFAFGTDADVQYLSAMADGTDGALWEVSDSTALAALFAQLGHRLSATVTVRIPVPPLTRGPHELALRVAADGSVHQATREFEVTNDGVLSLRAAVPGDPGDAIRVEVNSTVPSEAVELRASIRGRPLAVVPGQPPVVLVDPWEAAPGSHVVRVEAFVSGGPFSAAEAEVEVPALEPLLTLQRDDAGAEAVAFARFQPGVADVLVAIVDGEEVGRSAGPRLTFAVPDGASRVHVELRARGGEVLSSEQLLLPEAASAAPSSSTPLALPLLGLAAFVGVAGLLWLRRRKGAVDRVPALVRNRSIAAAPSRERRAADVVVTLPSGEQRHYPVGTRPFTVGRSSECDVVIDEAGVRPLHVRISPSGTGRFQVHGIGNRSARPYEVESSDEWLVISAGEAIEVGGHHLTIELGEVATGTNGQADRAR